MSEQQLQKKILTYLKSKGYYVFKTVVCNRKGIPDIVACSPQGKFLAIEVKAPGKLKTVSALQQMNLDQISNNNGLSLLVDSLDQVKKLI